MPEISKYPGMYSQTPYGLLNFAWGSILPTILSTCESLLSLFHFKIGRLPQETGEARRGCGRLAALGRRPPRSLPAPTHDHPRLIAE
jgi:hypothetical protein